MCRFGRGKREAEAFVGDFRDVCVMQRLRVMGDDVRLYKCYPGDWQAHACLVFVLQSQSLRHETCAVAAVLSWLIAGV